MFNFVAKLIGGAVAPLVQQASAFGAGLLRKLALFVVATLCLVVVVVCLTVAFGLWIASLAGAIAGVLAVALVYAVVAGIAIALALKSNAPAPAMTEEAEPAEAPADAGLSAKIDELTEPVLQVLSRFGLRREQLAVLAGASLAKRLRPLPLVGVAILAGFLLGRLWKGWGMLASTDLAASDLVAMVFDFIGRRQGAPPPPPEPTEEAA